MYTGVTGKISMVTAGGEEKTVGYISNWSIEDTADVLEFATLGEGYKTKEVGQQSWSASADGAVDFADASMHAKLFELKNGRKEVELKFYLSTENNDYLTGYGYIESLSVDLSAEDKGNISVSISGNSHVYTEGDKKVERGLSLYLNNVLQGA